MIQEGFNLKGLWGIGRSDIKEAGKCGLLQWVYATGASPYLFHFFYFPTTFLFF